TGRTLVRITDGNAFCYPMYFFIPSVTNDEKYIVYHRVDDKEVQIYSTELETGLETKLTNAAYIDTQWRPWCSPTPPGVLDHRSVLNPVTNEVLFFDGNTLFKTPVDKSAPEVVFKLPDDRVNISQNCVTPDGKWFAYVHHDRDIYSEIAKSRDWSIYYPSRAKSYETIAEAYNLETRETHEILRINSPIHHIFAYGNEHFIINHPVNENGMIFAPLKGGWYVNLRTKDKLGRMPCHCHSTARGVTYEAYQGHNNVVAGIMNPFTYDRVEFDLPKDFGYTHTGHDPEGRLFFYENQVYNEKETLLHNMLYLKQIENGIPEYRILSGHRKSYIEKAQKAHFHPRLTADRNYVIFTGGCPETKTNHIYMLDVRNLDETKGIELPWE
ncbi:MAG: hypothetical protein JXN10_06165, partial [Clostridia bacterium]|nr:hypothetical protein [Clostridia bacterium]